MFITLIEISSQQSINDFMDDKGVTVDNDVFTDTNDKNVLAANALNIINGVGNNKFDPNGILSRAQIAAIINRVARVMDVNTDGYTHSFTDVNGHWVSEELGWPVYAEIIEGIGNNRFNPNGNLTTEQAIAITYRAVAPLSK
jgi:NADPH-dependent 2,4-dienoyl-CoA reductase/sulfur reductase-like enzyme